MLVAVATMASGVMFTSVPAVALIAAGPNASFYFNSGFNNFGLYESVACVNNVTGYTGPTLYSQYKYYPYRSSAYGGFGYWGFN